MSRPRYCTPADRAREQAVVDRFVAFLKRTATGFKWDGCHLGQDAAADALIMRNDRPVAMVEIKNRTGSGARYQTWHIAKDKLDRCMAHCAKEGIQFILLMVWDGEMFFIRGDHIPMSDIRMGGRSDRNDVHDQEQMVHIPQGLFKRA